MVENLPSYTTKRKKGKRNHVVGHDGIEPSLAVYKTAALIPIHQCPTRPTLDPSYIKKRAAVGTEVCLFRSTGRLSLISPDWWEWGELNSPLPRLKVACHTTWLHSHRKEFLQNPNCDACAAIDFLKSSRGIPPILLFSKTFVFLHYFRLGVCRTGGEDGTRTHTSCDSRFLVS